MLGGIIRGKKVTLRTPREEDLSFINGLTADMRVRREGHVWDEPATAATWKDRLKSAAKDQGIVVWIVEAEGRAVGIVRIRAGQEDPRHADIEELTIDPAAWGRGFGSDAAVALHRYLFDYLDKRVCAIELAADNTRALRIAEKIGYAEFGRGHRVYFRDGAYADQVWLRFDRATWDERWAATEREYAPFPEGIER